MPRPVVPDRRGRIITAARQLLLEKGWPRTTIADIATEAGISKGAVYLEFPDKAAILDAILRASMRTMTARVRERVDRESCLIDLAAAYRFGIGALLEEPVMLALHLGDEAVLGEHVRDVADQRYAERAEWLTAYIHQLRHAGVLDSSVDVAAIVRTLSMFTIGAIHAPGLLGISDAAELTEAIQLFSDAIGQSLATNAPVDPDSARSAYVALLERLDHQLTLLEEPS